ncbi:MAG: ATP-binding protein [Aquimonas sp.]
MAWARGQASRDRVGERQSDSVSGRGRRKLTRAGPGMGSGERRQLLLPFYSAMRNGAGAGLGLALVLENVEAHGGPVCLAQREGGGLSVLLRIPRSER